MESLEFFRFEHVILAQCSKIQGEAGRISSCLGYSMSIPVPCICDAFRHKIYVGNATGLFDDSSGSSVNAGEKVKWTPIFGPPEKVDFGYSEERISWRHQEEDDVAETTSI